MSRAAASLGTGSDLGGWGRMRWEEGVRKLELVIDSGWNVEVFTSIRAVKSNDDERWSQLRHIFTNRGAGDRVNRRGLRGTAHTPYYNLEAMKSTEFTNPISSTPQPRSTFRGLPMAFQPS